jgi:S1-C subfamily serine protease
VRLADETEWEAELVGSAPDKDLAVLKINAPESRLKPIALGTSNNLRVGQMVLAIGNPFGLDRTLTTGIVSALGREIRSVSGRPIQDVIQTDAAINPGNSGGPLLDSAGRLVGINTQIASTTGANAGIGFAIPVDTVNRIVPQLIRHGHERRPGLGISLVPEVYARRWGFRTGAMILEVRPGSPAAEAGLQGTVVQRDGDVTQFGDVIMKINDIETPGIYALQDALERYNVGDEVTVTFIRDDETRQAKLKLQAIEVG